MRFSILKIFKPSLIYHEFLDSESGSNDFYNLIVGILTLCGLIFGIFYLFNWYEKQNYTSSYIGIFLFTFWNNDFENVFYWKNRNHNYLQRIHYSEIVVENSTVIIRYTSCYFYRIIHLEWENNQTFQTFQTFVIAYHLPFYGNYWINLLLLRFYWNIAPFIEKDVSFRILYFLVHVVWKLYFLYDKKIAKSIKIRFWR